MSGFVSGNTLLATLIGQATAQSNAYNPTMAYDVVGVFDGNFNQLFPDARPIKASVKEAARSMKHPAESGFTITDHRIILPISISLAMVLTPDTYVETYYQIKSVFLGTNTVAVQTNTGLYVNMMVDEMPHEENPDHFDTITLTLKLEEIRIVQALTSTLPDTQKKTGNKTGSAASASDASKATTKAKSSAAYSMLFGGKE